MPQFDTHEYVKNLGEELMPPPPVLGVPSGRGVRPTPAACPAALNAWLYHAIRAMRHGPRRPPLVVVEAALAHTVRNPTEAAYARSDLFERRRRLMDDGLCHRDEVTNCITISYNFSCSRFPSSYPSFAIRCPRALKTLCGRLEIVDRRDDHALIRRCGAPSPPPPLSPNDDRASASDAYAWPADRGTIEPKRRAGRSCISSDVRACSAAGAEPHATLDDAGTAETLLIQWQWWKYSPPSIMVLCIPMASNHIYVKYFSKTC